MTTGLETEAPPISGLQAESPEPAPILFVGGTGRSGTHVVSKILGNHSSYRKVPNEARFHTDPGGYPDVLAGRTGPDLFVYRLRHHWYRNFEARPAHLPRLPPLRPAEAPRRRHRLVPAPLRRRRARGRAPAALLRPALAARDRVVEVRPDRAELRHRRRGRRRSRCSSPRPASSTSSATAATSPPPGSGRRAGSPTRGRWTRASSGGRGGSAGSTTASAPPAPIASPR